MEELNRMVAVYLVSQRDEVSTDEYEKALRATSETARLVMDFCQRVGAKMDQPTRETMWLRVLEFMLSAIKSTDSTCGDTRKTGEWKGYGGRLQVDGDCLKRLAWYFLDRFTDSLRGFVEMHDGAG